MKLKLTLVSVCVALFTGVFAQQPHSGCWHPDFIRDWSPSKDPDAKFNKSFVPLQTRFTNTLINASPNQHPEGQAAACLTMHPMCSQVPSQGANNFIGYNPTYWQYLDLLIWWGGSAGEGIILPPSAPVIDAAHQSGVKVLGQVFFPPTAYGGQAAWVTQMLTVENGVYIYAKKLYEIAKYYGFDGWFINQETPAGDTSAQWEGFYDTYIACAAADGVVHELQWYDCGTTIGTRMNMIKKPGGSYFLNYGSPSASNISSQTSALTAQGFSVADAMKKAYFGIEVAQGGYGSANAGYYKNLYPKTGHLGSIDLFNPEEQTWKQQVTTLLNTPNNVGAQAYQAMKNSFAQESRFWVNTKNDPSNAAEYDNSNFPGMSTGIAERTFIQSKPFVTSFSAGLGKYRFVNGENRGTQDWYHRGMQDVLPTWRWWIDCPSTNGVKDLSVDMDWDDAYNVGTSMVVSGKLTASANNLMRLYKTNLTIAQGDVFQLVFKGDVSTLSLKVSTANDGSTFTEFPLSVSNTVNGWSVAQVDLSSLQGQTMTVIALNIKSTTDVPACSLRMGQLAILPAAYSPAVTQVNNLKVERSLTETGGDLRITWDQVASEINNIHHYNVYLERNGTKQLVGQTRSEGFYIPTFTRTSVNENSVKIYVAAVAKNLQEGTQLPLTVNYPALQAPVVQLKPMKTLIQVGEEVKIAARATNFPQTYTWNIPGGTLVRQNADTVVYKFTNEGVYDVSATVANSQASTTESVSGLIEVSNSKTLSNVGVGKTILSKSGELAPETASWLIDGVTNPSNIHNKWCIGGAKEHWAVIDLGSAHKLYRFRTYDCGVKESASDNMKCFKVYVSDDATNWTLVMDEKNRPETIKDDYIKPTVARYVKFVPYDTDVAITIRVWEFEIWGMPGNITLNSIPMITMNMNTTQRVEVPYDLGGDPVASNFQATVTSLTSSVADASNIAIDQTNKKISFDLTAKIAGKCDLKVKLVNGVWNKEMTFSVKAIDPDIVNVALNKTVVEATMGTKWDETGVVQTAKERVNDGDATTYWLSANNGTGYNMTIDLGNTYTLTSTIMKFIDDTKSNYPNNLVVSYSTDNSMFIPCASLANAAVASNEVIFPKPIIARYFRLSFDPRNNYGVKIAETEVYGKLASAVEPTTFLPINLGGFDADLIAEQLPSANYSNSVLDDQGWVFFGPTVQANGSLPQNGSVIVNGKAIYKLGAFDANNAISLKNSTTTKTLTFNPSVPAAGLAILATSANGTSTMKATVQYDDNTSEEITGITFDDWYGTSGKVTGLTRIITQAKDSYTKDQLDTRLSFRLMEKFVTLSSSTKKITAVSFTRTSTAGYPAIFAVTATGVKVADIPSAVDEVVNSGLKVYPNPISGNEMLKIELPSTTKKIELFNMQGVLVRSFLYTGKSEFSIKGLNSGVYVLRVTSDKIENAKLTVK